VQEENEGSREIDHATEERLIAKGYLSEHQDAQKRGLPAKAGRRHCHEQSWQEQEEMTRVILSKNWTRKPKAKHFLIRDKAKADRLERLWKAKSKRK
jgi:hypothetical protein